MIAVNSTFDNENSETFNTIVSKVSLF
jgi:hypothetical protein